MRSSAKGENYCDMICIRRPLGLSRLGSGGRGSSAIAGVLGKRGKLRGKKSLSRGVFYTLRRLFSTCRNGFRVRRKEFYLADAVTRCAPIIYPPIYAYIIVSRLHGADGGR